MSDKAKGEIERMLKPGWHLLNRDGTNYAVISPSGYALRDIGEGRELRINSHLWAGSPEHQRVVLALQNAGAIPKPPPRRRRRAQEQHQPRRSIAEGDSGNPIIMAREILADAHSAPRERSMARAFIKLSENHEAVRALAKALGARLRDYDR